MRELVLAWFAGLLVAMPPTGPITLLFYRRAVLGQLRPAGVLAFLAGLSDVVYAGLAAFGYAWLLQAHPALEQAMRFGGVVLVAALGLRHALFPPEVDLLGAKRSRGVRTSLVEGLCLALLNPSALVTWIVVMDLIRALGTGDGAPWLRYGIPVAAGLGAWMWFFGVLFAWARWGRRPSPGRAREFVRLVGVVLLVSAVVYAWRALQPG
jgi:threonine/homoserine/homoserine lactone efflux protein